MGKRVIIGFIAGVLGTIVFFTATWVFVQAVLGWIPPTAPKPWAYAPTVAPFGVPRFANLAFWGGVWGAALAVILGNARGAGYWILWTLVGALALTLVGNFVVPVIKGQSLDNVLKAFNLMRFRTGLVVNGGWGLGTAIVLKAMGQGAR